EWMRSLSDSAYAAGVGEFEIDPELLKRVIPLLKERAQTFGEARTMLSEELGFLFAAPSLDKELLTNKETSTLSTKDALTLVRDALQNLPELPSVEEVKTLLMPLADGEEAKGKGGRGGILWPLRYALSGLERSPDPFTLVSVLGTKETLSRVEGALAIL
ncbi:MAG: hypothetical protein AAB737_02095, partial [Patescibacteria group bacterium]